MARACDNPKIRLKVFRSLCWHDNDIISGWVPLPTTAIAQMLDITVYQVRKHMRTLVEEGLAVKTSCAIDLEDHFLPYNGFIITEKGRKKGIYQYIALKSARIDAACFGGSVESFLPKGFDTRWLHKNERKSEDDPASILAGLEKELEEEIC